MAISLDGCNCNCIKCSCNDLLQGLIETENKSTTCCSSPIIGQQQKPNESNGCKCESGSCGDSGVESDGQQQQQSTVERKCCPISGLIENTFFRFYIPQLKGNEELVETIKQTLQEISTDVIYVNIDYTNQIVQVECSVDRYLFKILKQFKSLNLEVAAIQSKECPELMESMENTPLLNDGSILQSPINNNNNNNNNNDGDYNSRERVFEIKGMKCEVGCANRIEATLLQNKNIHSVKINFKTKQLFVIASVNDRTIRKTIEKLGFKCQKQKQQQQQTSTVTSPLLLDYSNSSSSSSLNDISSITKSPFEPISSSDEEVVEINNNNKYNNSTSIEMESIDIKIDNNNNNNKLELIEIISIGVFGMTCASCVGMVEHSIKSVDGVIECNVNLLAERAEIKYNSSICKDVKEIQESIEILGFETKLIQQSKAGTFHLKLLNYQEKQSNKLNDEQPLLLFDDLKIKFQGISNLEIIKQHSSSSSQKKNKKNKNSGDQIVLLKVDGDSYQIGARVIMKSLKLDYDIDSELFNPETDDIKNSLMRKREIKKWKHLFIFSISWTLPLIIIAMILVPIKSIKFLHYQLADGFPVEALIGFILATPVQFISGATFYKVSYAAVKNLHGNMDLLVAVGSTCAYVYSVISIIIGIVNPMYEAMHFFETSASLITFIILGRWLENIAKGHTSSAIVKLMNLQSKETTLVTLRNQDNYNGSSTAPIIIESEEIIQSSLISYGDLLKVIPGQSIPTDGIVINGSSSCDESMITGESIPVLKKVNDSVTGGTLNLDGVLIIKANKIGSENTLSQIIGLVQQAQTSKAPIQQLADTISKYFVPIILLLGLITFGIWIAVTETNSVSAEWRHNTSPFLYSFLTAISVIVIACPCALGLATPTAVMVGTGVGASIGILIKGGKPLETAHKATAILFDKTGTITTGKMNVTDYRVNHQSNNNDNNNNNNSAPKEEEDKLFFKIVGAAESGSEHPIGKAIVQFCKQTLTTKGADPIGSPMIQDYQFPPVSDFKGIAGRGLSCIVDSLIQCKIGNLSFMKDNSINVPIEFVELAQSWETNGKTVIYVSYGDSNDDNDTTSTTTILFKGIMSISDIPRDDSKRAIKKLKSMGLKCYMVTGDNKRAAKFIANQVGIDEDHIYSEVIPKEKAEKVSDLQASGNVVCFVGDGVNDSPALSQADVGISVATGTDIAIESSSIVLLKNSLTDVYRSIHLSRVVFRRIKINFTLALIYNLCAVPLAAGLFRVIFGVSLPPMAAAAAMVVSSLSVLSSSLLLKLYSSPN
ncbi:P-type ATPase [Dictyostelium discoideum AX4]|uniref:P-type ATPase n=1 Tax=Dictyostelium discoideum TaxID=44689 RepID=Q557B5_DICDI|nr:P-type ATPase [Dictyostelium discoideum AX4]XP_644796.1 P-type ATPase [Dictyostelium discoideum AX4]EAL70528.1 P-type ATPase [Dictyostelium discoideum AX4]EAL70835.1 P-type ATPase [Dictyostelium discoideum AX4]|eukprot:XP_644454.1 P-type ATPase [Dictyostelium discoideum AX4]